jgi:hypothetical protein
VDVFVAVGTMALAIFTAALAWSTWHMAQAASAQAQAAERQASATGAQVERAHRPVLVPVPYSTDVSYRSDGTLDQEAGPAIALSPRPAAFLAAKNVGMGPALNVRGTFTAPRGAATVRFPTVGIAAGERGTVTFEGSEDLTYAWADDDTVEAMLEYDDVAGQTYRTWLVYEARSANYTSTLEFEPDVTAYQPQAS